MFKKGVKNVTNEKCKNCMSYFEQFKLCYEKQEIKYPNEHCDKWAFDNETSQHSEIAKTCDC